jgi:hypothetical protein
VSEYVPPTRPARQQMPAQTYQKQRRRNPQQPVGPSARPAPTTRPARPRCLRRATSADFRPCLARRCGWWRHLHQRAAQRAALPVITRRRRWGRGTAIGHDIALKTVLEAGSAGVPPAMFGILPNTLQRVCGAKPAIQLQSFHELIQVRAQPEVSDGSRRSHHW